MNTYEYVLWLIAYLNLGRLVTPDLLQRLNNLFSFKHLLPLNYQHLKSVKQIADDYDSDY